ncbi:MAG: bifunctional alpha,alpha-trehalose-phosphate synthase (UDP-forming)/trehalose-phosphatase [Pseudomonadota bacterium]
MSRQYIIVSNRLPLAWNDRKQAFDKSAGGLVSAIAGIPQHNLHWLGYMPCQAKQRLTSKEMPDTHFHPVNMPEAVYQDFYNGYCNRVLWPLFHYEMDKCSYQEQYWQAYCQANKYFCDSLLKVARPGDVIWIHDYQLMLLPHLLRKKIKKCLIGFFLHIPFPSSEIFQQLPNRRAILSSLLAADLIGFHDYNYLRHFSTGITRLLEIDNQGLHIDHDNFRTELGVFPASVDSTKIINRAKRAKIEKNKRFTFLGVDRLDYIKGIDLKLDTFDKLLADHPALHNKIELCQIAVPSRTDIPEYQALKHLVDEKVGQINGKYGTVAWSPIRYLTKNIDRNELVKLYKNADAMLVTSRRDGFNLVALEYILSQNKDNPGVLLLSEFAGAFSQLTQCLRLNPWHLDDTVEKMLQAMKMPLTERKHRWQTMFQYAKKYTAKQWSNTFLNKLINSQEQNRLHLTTVKPNKQSVTRLLRQHGWKKKSNLTLFIDYDGTLNPIVDDPKMAILSNATIQILTKLIEKNITIIVISGRPRAFLQSQLKPLNIPLIAEHGAFVFNPEKRKWQDQIKSTKDWYKRAKAIMDKYTELVPNSFIEPKTYSIVWHYRRSPSYFGNFQAYKLLEELKLNFNKSPVSVSRGHKVIEVKHVNANKGICVDNMIKKLHSSENFYIAIGDDVTDEDMFESIKGYGLAIKVGKGNTAAQARFITQKDVLTFLKTLANI